ncbi:hypothetical protein BC941DRAFT_420440 [Chlamydoabsidia padenii]|nr:hypothetical protein BC941DRAFT_420440 [Chlamydoabsidia padenii]
MSSTYTSIDPPFNYNPGCKPTKSILKQRTTTQPPSSSWLTRLSTTESPPQQRSFGYFRKLINTSSTAVSSLASDNTANNGSSSIITQTQGDELSVAELKRVRFSVRQMTTEYYPYASIKNEEDTGNDISNNTDTSSAVQSNVNFTKDQSYTATIGDKDNSTDNNGHTTTTTTLEKILSYYETACRNKEEPALEPFMVSLLTHRYASTLTSIDLSSQILTRRAAEPLADVFCLDFGLKKLTLRNCQLEDEALKVILHSLLVVNHLQYLDLTDNKKIQANGFKYISIFIKNASHLDTLDLTGTNPDKKSMQYLSQALSSTTLETLNGGIGYSKLKRLIMDNCNLKQPQLESLGNAIRKSSISYLSLRGNRINQQGAICIGVMLRNYDDDNVSNSATSKIHRLQHLILDNNDIRQGVQYIAQALRRNQSLRSLSMVDCKLDAECCVSVAESLKYNQSLEMLNISSNPLCTGQQLEGINSLKQSLYCNHSLSDLALAGTGIGSEGAVALAEFLPENNSLCRFDLSCNPDIDLAGFLALLSGLRLNSTLVFLDLSIPTNDRDMVKVQNEMAGLCTKNAQASDGITSRTPSLHSVDTTHTSITTTQATARLTLQERLEAVTRGTSSRSNSIRSNNSQENIRSSPRTRTTRRQKLQTNFDAEIGQVGLLEEMLQAEESTVRDNGECHPDDIIKQVYHQCRKGLLNLNNSIPQLMESEQLVELLGLNDRLTTAISRYEELYSNPPKAPPRPTVNETSVDVNEKSSKPHIVMENQDAERSTSPFAIGDDDDDNDQGDYPTSDTVIDIHELRKEKEVEEGVAFKHAKDIES